MSTTSTRTTTGRIPAQRRHTPDSHTFPTRSYDLVHKRHVFREHGLHHLDRITRRAPGLSASLRDSAKSPDAMLESLREGGLTGERTRHGIESAVELAGAAG